MEIRELNQQSNINTITIGTSTLGMLGGSAAIIHGIHNLDISSISVGFIVVLSFGMAVWKIHNNQSILGRKRSNSSEEE